MEAKRFTNDCTISPSRSPRYWRALLTALHITIFFIVSREALAQPSPLLKVNPKVETISFGWSDPGDVVASGNLRLNIGIGYLNTQEGSLGVGFIDQGFGPGISFLPVIYGNTVIEANGTEIAYSDVGGQLQSENRHLGDLSSLKFERGKPTVRSYADGSTEQYGTTITVSRPGVSQSFQLLSSVTDAAGRTTTITYSPGTMVPTLVTGPDGVAAARFTVTTPRGGGAQISKVEYPDGSFITCQYQGKYLYSVVGMDGASILRLTRANPQYNLVTQLLTPSGPSDIHYELPEATSWKAIVVGISNPDGSGTTYSRNNKTKTATARSVQGFETKYVYSESRRQRPVVKSIHENGTKMYEATFSPGKALIKEWTYPGIQTSYTYTDDSAAFISRVDVRGEGTAPISTTVYTYTTSGNVASVATTLPGGTTEERYTYDSSNRLTKVSYLGGGNETAATTFSYDGASKLPSSSSTTENISTEVSERGAPTKVTLPNGTWTSVTRSPGAVTRNTMGFMDGASTTRSDSGRTFTATTPFGSTIISSDLTGNRITRNQTITNPLVESGSATNSGREITLMTNTWNVTSSGSGMSSTESCSSKTDDCTTTYSCTANPGNPAECNWSETTTCRDKCVPSCATATCGGSDRCGGRCQTGSCPSGNSCVAGACVRQNQCGAKVCGLDAAGNSCGSCPSNQSCNAQGQCVSNVCKPNCNGKSCGNDDCGGKCGICGAGSYCNGRYECARDTSSCVPNCSGKQCGLSNCGTPCGTCASGYQCNASGQCVAEVCRTEGQPCGPTIGNCCAAAICLAGACHPQNASNGNPGTCNFNTYQNGGENQCNAGFAPTRQANGTCKCDPVVNLGGR